jgi:hypothetical protein
LTAQATHLLFVWRPTGYELAERPGPAPALGVEIDLGEDAGGRFLVVKVGSSPLPDDGRRCAYLQPA